jgi:hypothetical protein
MTVPSCHVQSIAIKAIRRINLRSSFNQSLDSRQMTFLSSPLEKGKRKKNKKIRLNASD